MAKLVANCVLMGVGESSYRDKKTQELVVQHTANLYFTDDSSMLPVGVDRKKPELLTSLQGLKMVEGLATVAIREFKGVKFLDLVGFEKSKK